MASGPHRKDVHLGVGRGGPWSARPAKGPRRRLTTFPVLHHDQLASRTKHSLHRARNLNPKMETTHVGTCSLADEASCGVDVEEEPKQGAKPGL